jgi:hypothetical protein
MSGRNYQPRLMTKPRDASRGMRRSASSPWSSRCRSSILPPQPRVVFNSWSRDASFVADQAGEKPSRTSTVLPPRWAVERRRRRRSAGAGADRSGSDGMPVAPDAGARPEISKAAKGLIRSGGAASVAMRCFFSRGIGVSRNGKVAEPIPQRLRVEGRAERSAHKKRIRGKPGVLASRMACGAGASNRRAECSSFCLSAASLWF